MDEDGESLRFYVGEPVDNILSFKLANDEAVGLITFSQSKGTISFWEWDVYDTKLPVLTDSLRLSPISSVRLLSTNLGVARFLVAEKDNGFSLFQVSDSKIQKLHGPVGQENILCFDVSRNGTHFLAGGEDGFLRFYSSKDLSSIKSIRASAASVYAARFATDTIIFTASSNKVEVWDLKKSVSEPILYLEPKPKDTKLTENNSVFIWDICVHPDQPFICAAVDNEGKFSLWDLRMNKLAQQIFTSSNLRDSKTEPIQHPLITATIHKGNILKASFVVSSPRYIVTCGEDGVLQLIDLEPLGLNPTVMETLQTERIVRTRKLLTRFSSISDFSIEDNVILTANDDESISVKTLDI